MRCAQVSFSDTFTRRRVDVAVVRELAKRSQLLVSLLVSYLLISSVCDAHMRNTKCGPAMVLLAYLLQIANIPLLFRDLPAEVTVNRKVYDPVRLQHGNSVVQNPGDMRRYVSE